jgi:hypothetical protein
MNGRFCAHSVNRAILVLAFAALAIQAQAETPRQFAERFYRGYFRWQIRGVPSTAERRRIAPFFSSEILRLYAATDQQTAEFDRLFPFDPKHPEDAFKPPWSKEGDPFSGTYEGISAFAIGPVIRVGRHVAVEAHLEYTERGMTFPWTDVLVLDRAGSDWVVSDIRFAGGDSLVASMRKGLSETERELSQNSK